MVDPHENNDKHPALRALYGTFLLFCPKYQYDERRNSGLIGAESTAQSHGQLERAQLIQGTFRDALCLLLEAMRKGLLKEHYTTKDGPL